MSVSKWAYSPDKCDGDYCSGDCDYCNKADKNEDEPEFTQDDCDRARAEGYQDGYKAGQEEMKKKIVEYVVSMLKGG